MKKYQVVRLTQQAKDDLRGECGKVGYHTRLIDGDCYACSSEHADEFQNSLGIVREIDDDLIDVLWVPENLHYHYLSDHLKLAVWYEWPFAYLFKLVSFIRVCWHRMRD